MIVQSRRAQTITKKERKTHVRMNSDVCAVPCARHTATLRRVVAMWSDFPIEKTWPQHPLPPTLFLLLAARKNPASCPLGGCREGNARRSGKDERHRPRERSSLLGGPTSRSNGRRTIKQKETLVDVLRGTDYNIPCVFGLPQPEV